MPSGAKKRKAAKKKKENLNQSHNHSHSAYVHPQGDENVKHQEDRESDAGETISPTSQDFRELPIEAEREDRGTSAMEGSRADNGEEQVEVVVSVVLVEKEIKIEDELGVKDGIVNQNEAERNSSDGDSSRSSSSSSSSDDEKNEQTVESDDSVPSTIVAPCVIESTLEENVVQKLSSVEESVSTSVNAASYGEEEANVVRSAESSLRILDPKACATQENDDRSTSSYIDSGAAINNGAQHAKDSVVTELKRRRGRVAVDYSKCLQDLARKFKNLVEAERSKDEGHQWIFCQREAEEINEDLHHLVLKNELNVRPNSER